MVTFKHRRWDCPNCRQFQRHTEALSCPLRVLSRCLISCYVQTQQRSKGEPNMDGVPQLAVISTALQLLWLWLKRGSWGFFEGPVFSLHPGLQVPLGKTISDFMSAHFIMKETISLTLTCKAFVGEGAFWKISLGCGGKQARNPIAHWCCTKHKQMT